MSSTADSSSSMFRAFVAGLLMGAATLVPGVNGVTMILAVGLFDRFVGALADVTRFRFERSSVLFLALLGSGVVLSIVALSGVAVDAVTNHRWIMYSLSIGLTLGGAPGLWKECRPVSLAVVISFALSLALMALLAWGLSSSKLEPTVPVLLVAGALAAAALILPGISGSYLLLVFGLYDVLLGAIRPSALFHDTGESLRIVVPAGIGVALGMALLSNALKVLLARFGATTNAALLGLLLGSVPGLWPFQAPVHPELANKSTRKAIEALVAGEELAQVNEEHDVEIAPAEADRMRAEYGGKTAGELKLLGDELARFDPSALQIAAALALFIAGLGITRVLGRYEEGKAA